MNTQTLIDWIQLATIGVLIATVIIQGKQISNLGEDISEWKMKLRNERKERERHENLFNQLLTKLEMKTEIKHTETGYTLGPIWHREERIVHLTDDEKEINRLRRMADRLEREEE